MTYPCVQPIKKPTITTFTRTSTDNGVGEDYNTIIYDLTKVLEHFFATYTREQETPEIKFSILKNEWEVDTSFLSSITEICMHPAYQQIIGMGEIALPLIFSELQQKINHWFWALKCITSHDPTPSEYKGKIEEMTKAWLNWGKENNYIK